MKKITLNENEEIEKVLSQFPPGEHDWFEVKGNRFIDISQPNVNRNWESDLSKTIGAMANTGGGYIVFGADDSPNGCILDGYGIKRDIKGNGTKKWLEDILTTSTDPFIQNINVYEFTKSSEKQLTDTALYIVEVDDSPLAPHQSRDNKYYIRTGSSSRPASHRIVLDMLGRRKNPIIQVDFAFDLYEKERLIVLNTVLTNIGKVIANVVTGFLFIPNQLTPTHNAIKQRTSTRGNTEYWMIDISNINALGAFPTPILREISFLKSVQFYFDENNFSYLYNSSSLYWEIAADNGPLVQGYKRLKEIVVNRKKL